MSFLKKNKNLNRPSNCRVPGVYIKKKKKKTPPTPPKCISSSIHRKCFLSVSPSDQNTNTIAGTCRLGTVFSFQGFTLIHSHQLPLRVNFGNVTQTLQSSIGKSSSTLNLRITYLCDVYIHRLKIMKIFKPSLLGDESIKETGEGL